jgi:hypothetical protein
MNGARILPQRAASAVDNSARRSLRELDDSDTKI